MRTAAKRGQGGSLSHILNPGNAAIQVKLVSQTMALMLQNECNIIWCMHDDKDQIQGQQACTMAAEPEVYMHAH